MRVATAGLLGIFTLEKSDLSSLASGDPIERAASMMCDDALRFGRHFFRRRPTLGR